jgi:hypothetical protein
LKCLRGTIFAGLAFRSALRHHGETPDSHMMRIKMNRLMNLIGAAAGFALVASPALAGVVAPVPEPTSIALLAAGIGGVALAKFRRRK